MTTHSGGIREKITDYRLADSGTDNEFGGPSEENYSNSDGYDSPPPMKKHQSGSGSSKRSKNPRSSTTGREDRKLYRGRNVGKLAKLMQMPVDIFREIAPYLEPLDLLHLARSSRSFNNLLMSRSSKSIWRAARSSLDGLPDCPPDLSEPAYARLLFEKYCHECLTARVMRADYILRVRLCHGCAQSRILKGTALLRSIPGLTVDLLECAPFRRESLQSFTGEVSRHAVIEQDRDRRPRSKYFLKDQVEELFAELQSVIPEELSEGEKSTLRREFYVRRKQLVKEAVEQGSSLDHWMDLYLAARKSQEVDIARQREASLKAKLIELGYEDSDFPREWENTEWTLIMQQPRDLTPRIWTTVRPKLEACIERVRKAREKQHRQHRQRERRSELWPFIDSVIKKRAEQDKQLVMTVDEALRLPTVVALAEEEDFNQVVTQERWDDAASQVEKEMDEFADHTRNFLTGLIRASLTSSSASASSVDHAPASASTDGDNDGQHDIVSLDSAYFQCSECSSIHPLLKYPALLSHGHSAKFMTFNATLSKYARLLLPFFGGVSEDKLCTLGRQLQCLRCDEDYTYPMDWSSLIIHFKFEQDWYDEELLSRSNDPSLVKAKLHNDHDIHNPTLDSPPCRILDYDVAKALDSRAYSTFSDKWQYERYYTCGLCTWNHMESLQKEVESHIRRKHLKEPEPEDVLECRRETP